MLFHHSSNTVSVIMIDS